MNPHVHLPVSEHSQMELYEICAAKVIVARRKFRIIFPKIICLLISLNKVALYLVTCPLLYVFPRLLFFSKIFTVIITNVFFISVMAYLCKCSIY